MSILIGYWTNGNEAQYALQRRLADAVSEFDAKEIRIKSSTLHGSSSARESNNPHSPPSFAIATHGRNASVEKCASESSMKAALGVARAGGAPDIWIKASNDELILGRGIFGRATLFWTQTEAVVWFASRLELLLRVVDRPRVSISGFHAYCCMSYLPAPLTPVENIFAVPAGNEITWSARVSAPQNRSLHEWRESDEQISDEKEATHSLRRLLEESVETELEHSTNEPLGVFLSGGLDSAVTAALLVRAGAKLRAYTLDFGNDCPSEVPYAETVARSLGIPLKKIRVTPDHMRGMLASTAQRLDGVYGDGVTVPLALLHKHASEEVGIVFNGEGGDQLFAGWTNKPLIAASLYECDPKSSDSEQTFLSHYMRTFHRLHGHERYVYADNVLRQIDERDVRERVAQALEPTHTRNLLHRLRRANLLLKGADNIQPRAANLALSYSLDLRTLFCSRRLAEWTFSVSGDLWLRGGCEKYLLKRVVEDLLPGEIVWREKRGMGVPLTLWLTGRLRRWMRRQLSPRLLATEGLWQTSLPERIETGELSGHIHGRRIGETLWLMLMWQAWHDHMLSANGEQYSFAQRVSKSASHSYRASARRSVAQETR